MGGKQSKSPPSNDDQIQEATTQETNVSPNVDAEIEVLDRGTEATPTINDEGPKTEPPVEESSEEKIQTPLSLPPLPLANLPQQSEAVKVEEVEEDPDLMKPPPLLVNATGALEDIPNTEVTEETNITSKEKDVSKIDENVILTSPITHDQVIFDEPRKEVEKSEPMESKEPDSISIDEEICAADEEEKPKGEGVNEKPPVPTKTSSGQLETISLSSSQITKGDEEYMKGIMGVSLNWPDATSNESIIGSVAVSETTLDESLWDNNVATQSRASTKEMKTSRPERHLVELNFQVQENMVLVVFAIAGVQEPELKAATVSQEVGKECIPEVEEEEETKVAQPMDQKIDSDTSPRETKATTSQNIKTVEEVNFAVPEPTTEVYLMELTVDDETTDVLPGSKDEESKVDTKDIVMEPLTEPLPVSLNLKEEYGNVHVDLSVSQDAWLVTQASVISGKEASVELITPFESYDSINEMPPVEERAVLETVKESSKSEKTKKPKRSSSTKGTGHKSLTPSSSTESHGQKLSPKRSVSTSSVPKSQKSSPGKSKLSNSTSTGGTKTSVKGRKTTGKN